MPRKDLRGYASQAIVPYVQKHYGELAANTASYLLSKPASKVTSPAKAIDNTKLKTYLDRRYERKCGVEVKQQETATSAIAITTSLASLESPFIGIAQGLTDATRIGNTLEVKSYRVDATFYAGMSSTAVTYVRVMVIKQGQMQLAALTGAAVLQDPSNIRSPILLDKQRSFTVIQDKFIKLAVPASGNDSSYHWRYTYRPKSCHTIKFTQADTTGVIGDCLEGNLMVMVMYDQFVGTASTPTVKFYSRAEWVDS